MFPLLSCCVEFQNPMTLFNCYDTEIEVIPLISLIFLALIYGDSNNRQQLLYLTYWTFWNHLNIPQVITYIEN